MRSILIFAALLLLGDTVLADPKEKDYRTWREFFTAIAAELDMDQSPEDVFNLAVDSTVEITGNNNRFILVMPKLIAGSGDSALEQLRGASGNGPFYLLKRTDKGFHLLGSMEGNQCTYQRLSLRNNAEYSEFQCSWRSAASSTVITKYETDGVVLRKIVDAVTKGTSTPKP